MRVSQLMSSDVVTLDADATLDIADDLMRLERIRHLPVVRDGTLVGIVSQRDLFRAGLSSAVSVRRAAEQHWLRRIPVHEVMVVDLVSIPSDADVDEAVARLLDHKIGCLPVVDGGKLVGLLSETDCLQYLRRILHIAEVKRRIAEDEDLTDLA